QTPLSHWRRAPARGASVRLLNAAGFRRRRRRGAGWRGLVLTGLALNGGGFRRRRRRGAGWRGLVLAGLPLFGAALRLIAASAIRLIKGVGLLAHFEARQEFDIAWHR